MVFKKKKPNKEFEEADFGEEIKSEISPEAPVIKETLAELREKIRLAEEENARIESEEIKPPEIEPAKKKTEPIAIIKNCAMGEPGIFQYVIETNYLLKLGLCDLRQ